jgi:hypothetical protein
MTGVEVLVILVGILAGFAQCSQYATEVIEKLKQKRAYANAVKQAERLESSLRGSTSAIGDELYNLKTLNRSTRLGYGTFESWVIHLSHSLFKLGPSEASLKEAIDIINALQKLLQSREILFPPDLSRCQTMADQSRNLTLESLHQLTRRLIAATSTSSLMSSYSLLSGSTAVSSQTLVFNRTQANFHNTCRNAVLYRTNCYEFEQLTIKLPNGNEKWACIKCGMALSEFSLRLSPSSSDIIWISAAGWLKAHCERLAGQVDGWTCIWPVISSECNARFDGVKRLLKHMKQHHVKLGTGGRRSTIHWPADIRGRSSDRCGFGATIGGQVMQDSESCFIVPGSTS